METLAPPDDCQKLLLSGCTTHLDKRVTIRILKVVSLLIETAATTSLSICPEYPIGFDIEERIAADKACQSPKAHDPSAGIGPPG